MKFKVGDRVVVGPNGLTCASAAAGKVAVVDEVVNPTSYYLKFNEPEDGYISNKSIINFATDDQISLAPPEGPKWINVTMGFRVHGDGKDTGMMTLSSCDAQNSHLSIRIFDGQCFAAIRAHPDDARTLRDKLLEIYPIDQPAKVEVAEVAEADEEMSWVVCDKDGRHSFYSKKQAAIKSARISAATSHPKETYFVAKVVGTVKTRTYVDYNELDKV